MFAQGAPGSGDAPIANQLLALSRLEATPNAIRLRIAGLAPDQLYRGTIDQLSIAEEIALAVDRERAYLSAFQRSQKEAQPHLEEPQPGPPVLDRDFSDDLATFFDLRRNTIDLLRRLDAGWEQGVLLPGGSRITLSDLAIRLAQADVRMLRTISEQRKVFLRTSGVDELRDFGVAGKLGSNIAQ